MNRDAHIYHEMALDAAKIGAFFLLVFFGLEAWTQGFVARFMNVHWLLLWVAAASLVAFFSHQPSAVSDQERKVGFWLPMFGLVAALYIWTAFPDLTERARIVAASGAFVVPLLAAAALKKD